MSVPVAITGMGAVTAAGMGVDALWQAVRNGEAKVSRLDGDEFARSHVRIAARSPFDMAAHFSPSQLRTLDRFSGLAIAAAQEAITAAKAEPREWGDRVALIIGTGIGGIETTASMYGSFTAGTRGDPMAIPKIMPNAAACQVAMAFGITGTLLATAGACSSSAQAIGLGLQLIRAGIVDRAIVGGTEAMVIPSSMLAWEMLRVLTPTAQRPFSKGRDGMMMGEGAGVMVLERLDLAEERGAPIVGMLRGYGTTSDAKDLLRADPVRSSAAISQALASAGLTPADIAYCNAHGTATIANDVAEAEALSLVFGSGMDKLAVSSTKPIHGHLIGAAGAVEAIVTVKALNEGIAPPTINFLEPDPAMHPINCVPNTAQSISGRIGISNSFAFGGINCSLVLSAA
ncbi:beta-ketoacyl synthase [Devosia sp.]|uniref:beta-ketoacyl-[acyl-carrier-protein] synthase family protein n=1 Tax=Devosia sp. TaxID=1871048 RepID=UPI0025BFED7E|nr:beta-ketoacyl-[acyl-carrier-protein] synthase family protein [Devosia sp.]